MSFEVINKQIKNTKEEILAELQASIERHNAIGIILKDTQELLTTAVTEIEQISEASDYVVVLMEHDLHGYPLERNRILLSNIGKVIHFNVDFDDPQYVKVRRKEKFRV